MCPRPLNRGVRLIKVSFKVNKGNKFGDFGYCPLNRGCPLNTGFTVINSLIESWEVRLTCFDCKKNIDVRTTKAEEGLPTSDFQLPT